MQGGHCNCGLAFPAKMWKKAHGFYGEVDWSVLEREGQKGPSDKNPVTVWYQYMKEKYTAQ
eukprot:9691373-Prorocentrum_lima.AAC.1